MIMAADNVATETAKASAAMVLPCSLTDFLLFQYSSVNMMTSSNGNIFRVTGHLCGEFTGPQWFPRTKASDAEVWFFLWSASESTVEKQWWGWWFATQSFPLWRLYNGHCNDTQLCNHEQICCKTCLGVLLVRSNCAHKNTSQCKNNG